MTPRTRPRTLPAMPRCVCVVSLSLMQLYHLMLYAAFLKHNRAIPGIWTRCDGCYILLTNLLWCHRAPPRTPPGMLRRVWTRRLTV